MRRRIEPQPTATRTCPSVPADMPGAQMRYLPSEIAGAGNEGWYWITEGDKPGRCNYCEARFPKHPCHEECRWLPERRIALGEKVEG